MGNKSSACAEIGDRAEAKLTVVLIRGCDKQISYPIDLDV